MIVCVQILFTSVVTVIQRHARNDQSIQVWDDSKVPDDSGKVPKTEWNDWWFFLGFVIFFTLLNKKTSKVSIHLVCSKNKNKNKNKMMIR